MENFRKYVSGPLVLIGALNWGLIGIFNFNLITLLFGIGMLTKIIYILVGVAAIVEMYGCCKVLHAKKN